MNEMTPAECESICDGCGRCCLHKLEDEETGDVHYTDVVCQYFDEKSCQCTEYQNRLVLVPQCVKLEVEDIDRFHWLPPSCSYKILHDTGDLPSWHPLLTNDVSSVFNAGISIRGRVISEKDVSEDDWEERIIYWVDE
ncbi:MAG: YcgN family cysteine cluster protein [Pseudomonadales bacterium]|nr:YcgN family cysteine cluster protein [Pseudomonadales bacterium]